MLPMTGWAWRSRAAIQSFACLRFRQRGRSASHVRDAACRKVGGLARRFAASGSPPERASRRFSNACPRPRRGSPEESRPTRDRGGGQEFTPVASRIPHPGRDSLQRCHRRNQTVRGSSPCGRRCRPEVGVPLPARHFRSLMHVETEAIPLFGVFPAARLRRAVPTGGRRSLASGSSGWLWSGPVKNGGGGGNRTRVRKSSATTSTCISGLWAGTRARRRLSLFRSRVASTRRIAARNLSLVLTDGSGRPPAKPA